MLFSFRFLHLCSRPLPLHIDESRANAHANRGGFVKVLLRLYPLSPGRVADTRQASYPTGLGAPSMTGASQRSVPVPRSMCCVPTRAGLFVKLHPCTTTRHL